MAEHNALRMKNVSFKFTTRAPFFFNNLDVSFAAQKIHFIRGANGVGKSTLFRLLQGKIDSGEHVKGSICLQDNVYTYDDGSLSKKMSSIKMVHQDFDSMLAPNLSFKQNLQLAHLPTFPTLSRLPEHRELPDFVKQLSLDVNIPVHLLSGGQRQILAIMMMLQTPTSVLLLDEPTAALDDKNSRLVMTFLAELVKNSGLTVLIICHDRELVEQYAAGGFYELVLNEETQERNLFFKKDF